jgi:hypothetical protein
VLKKLSLSERRFELEQKRLILELGLAGVSQRRIREIVGCDLNLVTLVLRHVPKKRQPQEE